MTLFRRYDHVERLGHPEVRDIDVGTLHVFPKLDGTNASVWSNNGHVCAGSRNRELSVNNDNHGFCAWVHGESGEAVSLRRFVLDYPHLILYGEWLVKHSLSTYLDDAWRHFYVFDVFDRNANRYLPFEEYTTLLVSEAPEVDVIHPLCTAANLSENQLREIAEQNTYLIKDGEGVGEGVVIKNYAWHNKFGRQPWAKIVRNEFKERNSAAFGPRHIKGERDIATEIVEKLATAEFIRKEWHKVVYLVANDLGLELYSGDTEPDIDGPSFAPFDGFVAANRHKIIPRFLGTLFYEFVQEEVRTIIKKWKNPVLDFGRLQKLLTMRAKEVMKEVF